MNPRDVWFVGLLALAYLYLDSAAPARRDPVVTRAALPPAPEGPAFTLKHVCPRDHAHPVSIRRDGAKWCLVCDEAFYPAALVI